MPGTGHPLLHFAINLSLFFRSVHDHLTDGGILGLNVSGFSRDEPVIRAIVNSAACAFGSVSLARIPEGRNFMLYAVKGRGHVPPSECRTESLPASLHPLLEKISVYGLTRGSAYDLSAIDVNQIEVVIPVNRTGSLHRQRGTARWVYRYHEHRLAFVGHYAGYAGGCPKRLTRIARVTYWGNATRPRRIDVFHSQRAYDENEADSRIHFTRTGKLIGRVSFDLDELM